MKSYFSPFMLPFTMGELFFSSAEVIARRSQMMAAGELSPPEFMRMWTEKYMANLEACAAFSSSCMLGHAYADMAQACLKPYHKRAGANVKRLRPRS